MLKTPHHISQKIDSIIDKLNCKWDLRLPRLYGSEACDALNDSTLLARRCSSRIRYLCFRSEDSIESCLAEFEDQANNVLSLRYNGEAHRPSLLRSGAGERSFLQRDTLSAGGEIAADRREVLLRILSDLLDDEFRLARDSENYQRTTAPHSPRLESGCLPPTTASAARPRTPSPTKSRTHDKDAAEASASPQKKRKILDEARPDNHVENPSKTGTAVKAQQNLLRYFQKSKGHLQVPHLGEIDPMYSKLPVEQTHQTRKVSSNQPIDLNTSFETTTSIQPSVFNQAVSQGSDSSVDTSPEQRHPKEESQDYFPTQDANEYFADVSFSSELHAADQTKLLPDFTLEFLQERTPFKPTQDLPKHLTFWVCWELCRIAQSMGFQPHSLYTAMSLPKEQDKLTYDAFWERIRGICKKYDKRPPPRSDVMPWMESTNNYTSPEGKTASFTFDLEYMKEQGPNLWRLKLNPIKVDRSNRIHRKFGPDRHAIGSLNYYDKTCLPQWVVKQKGFNKDTAFQKISHWLATEDHHIAGRTWRCFYIEPERRKNQRSDGEVSKLKLSLFAVDGMGVDQNSSKGNTCLASVGIKQLIDWHIPPQENLKSTNLKLFSRFGLALSRTISTIILRPCQFRYLPDVEPVMNDGCAMMSLGMAKAVWDICGDGSAVIPSAFQARIGGAKGIWVIDYRGSDILDYNNDIWIQVSDSQLKIKPHPRDNPHADETQRCFEVLKWSKPCVPGHLNIQLINILADRGVPRSMLRQIVLDDIEVYVESARQAMREPRLLLSWLQMYHSSNRCEEPIPFEDGLPETKEDEMTFLVQSGFSAENCEHVRRGMIALMAQRLNTYVKKLRIEVPYSTTAFCVPDPYQVLEEHEVFMAFSQPWEISDKGVWETALTDINVLVARNPAALASDIQKRRAVYKHELRHFRDVIIFSTKGTTPLASLLSGGDYDGDTVTVIWHPPLVDSFHNIEKPELPNEAKCGLVVESRKVQDIFNSPEYADAEIDEFLTTCIHFNARQSRLGICMTKHEKLVYSGAKLLDPGPILLAALAGYLVDANKQGLTQTDEAWYKISKSAQAGRKLFDLAYKNDDDNMPRRWQGKECVNIMDYLKFDVAMKRKDGILTEFENLLPHALNYDPELSVPYKRELARTANALDPQSKEVLLILQHLKNQLNIVHNTWLRVKQQREKNPDEKRDFTSDIRYISSMIKDIEPPELNCDIFTQFLREDKHRNTAEVSNIIVPILRTHLKGTRWSLLRASAMYYLFNKGKITWRTVGDELARIKARSQGSTRELTPAMHHVLKADTKVIKWLTGRVSYDETDDTED